MARNVLKKLLVAAVATASGCYAPAFGRCQVSCGDAGACPSGTACGSDRFCHDPGDTASCLPLADGGSDAAGDAATDATASDAGPPAPCDPLEEADPIDGVFVSGEDGAAGGSGDAFSPLDTIGAAVVLARATGRSRVYVEEGTYPEAVAILDATTGVTIDGAWVYTGLTWARDCAPDNALRTLIRPDGPIGVTAIDVTHLSGLTNLSVGTAAASPSTPTDAPGGSRIAVLVRGDGSAFRLSNVVLVPGDGEAGGPASPGALGAGALACDGMTDCSLGGTGATGVAGGDATADGTFDAFGFTPSDGAAGSASGGVGDNGTPGDPTDVRTGCNTGCWCSICFTSFDGTITSVGGTCGCGGNGGGPGAAGRGGGASVALLVSGFTAAVSVEYSVLSPGDGGDGSSGGAGGAGAGGTSGLPGSGAQTCHHMDCIGACGMPADCGYNPADWTDTIPARAAGGTGGLGGTGSAGGGGAGGPSYAVVTLAGALVVTDAATSLVPGAGGQGAGGASDGAAAPAVSF